MKEARHGHPTAEVLHCLANALIVGGKRLHLIATIGEDFEQSLHPVRVLL
jgi:hypothetical protein